ncbi:MAG TPA: hypothetical protein VFS96_00310, partial [Nitrolancea sp.]|nr:hypothetical protein [Nitrolancea sp.]
MTGLVRFPPRIFFGLVHDGFGVSRESWRRCAVEIGMLLKTERLLLREFEEDDWSSVLSYQTDPRYLRYSPWTQRTEADAREL